MASTNKTPNYDLSQYIGSDKPTFLGDYNSDMSKIDTAMKNNSNKINSIEKNNTGLNGRVENLETTSTNHTEEISNLNDTLTNLLPIGSVIPFAGSTIPEKWLECNGSAISRETYSELFNAIGVNYGVGDGLTTFNIPNLKEKIPVGHDPAGTEFDVIGKTGGEKTHTLTTQELATHSHTSIYAGGSQLNINSPGTGTALTITTDGTSTTTGYNMATNSAGGGQPHNNLQPYIVMKYIIKAKI